MQFADPQATSTAYLILRHLYDGDVIEWPIEEGHPLQEIFVGLEQQSYVARWDRVWPLHDRYRLTDRGIAAIEAVYRPAGADQLVNDVRQRNLNAAQRRAYLQQQRLDPVLWPLLHDPSTHWTTYGSTGSRYQTYFWEDQYPRHTRHVKPRHPSTDNRGLEREVEPVPYLVDLDRQAQDPGVAPASPDYDVS